MGKVGSSRAISSQRGGAGTRTERRFPIGFDRAMKEDFQVPDGILRWPIFPRAKPIENRRSAPGAAALRSDGFQPALRPVPYDHLQRWKAGKLSQDRHGYRVPSPNPIFCFSAAWLDGAGDIPSSTAPLKNKKGQGKRHFL